MPLGGIFARCCELAAARTRRATSPVEKSAGLPSARVPWIVLSSAERMRTLPMTDPLRTQRILAELKGEGLRLAIDDFGTGHSSLSRLKHIPADLLKIDRPFLAGVPEEASSRSMVKAIVEVAHGLGMQPLAEGIETEPQRRFLVESGCEIGQGFYFSAAVAASEIPRIAGNGAFRISAGTSSRHR